ncbi:hypothetical protein SteCoe_28825 [Stentor coeruleus]|uniref:Uncharacterized protein n=1 Tax=Stentor coeruleus TaxID=5963 RepID=A0A1R2B7V1_9CILI|nr:hypothetical protein SteCoe_28825 [Stentor coeruleus]
MERAKLIVKLPEIKPENFKTSPVVTILNNLSPNNRQKKITKNRVNNKSPFESRPRSIISILPKIPRKPDFLIECNSFTKLSYHEEKKPHSKKQLSQRSNCSSEVKIEKSPKSSRYDSPVIASRLPVNDRLKELFAFKKHTKLYSVFNNLKH